MSLPTGFMSWNRAMRGAYLKGLRARLAEEPCSPPYRDARTASGRLTWSRAFSAAWCDGWRDADKDPRDALITAAHSKGLLK